MEDVESQRILMLHSAVDSESNVSRIPHPKRYRVSQDGYNWNTPLNADFLPQYSR
jgi:hypothetical protein